MKSKRNTKNKQKKKKLQKDYKWKRREGKGLYFIKEEKERVAWANIAKFSLNMGVMTSMEERRVE